MKNKYFAKTAKGYGALLVILAVLLILSGIIAISLGAVDIPMADTIHVLAGKLARNESLYAELGKSAVAIVWNMRVPREQGLPSAAVCCNPQSITRSRSRTFWACLPGLLLEPHFLSCWGFLCSRLWEPSPGLCWLR